MAAKEEATYSPEEKRMNFASIICWCAISGTALLFAGCANKSLHSGGDNFSSKGTERINPNPVLAKADRSGTGRQLDEMRAEQIATAAAGLQDVFFEYDSWAINEEGRQFLTRDADWLRAHGITQVKVEGHCDERGSATYNFVLAEKRAKAVRNYLMELGVKGDRLIVVSYGKERPFCNDHSESCHRQNRRGHLVINR
jgi:peptidoglycan-associated lipoprotein